jgi:ribosomal protein S18 acetylase RimI-like enzyme
VSTQKQSGIILFKDLTEQQKNELLKFLRVFQPFGTYESLSAMDEVFGGSIYEYGKHHLSLWRDGMPKVTLGWVDREIQPQGIFYLSHCFSTEEGLVDWQNAFNEVISQLKQQGHQTPNGCLEMRFGIRGSGLNHLENWAVQSSWQPLYAMVLMEKCLSCEGLESVTPFQIQILNKENWQAFKSIQNEGFKQVPNGMLLSDADLEDALEAQAKGKEVNWLMLDMGKPVAISTLIYHKANGKVTLDALAVDPQFHGRGVGWQALQSLEWHLSQLEPEITHIELMVMDANTRAYQLYLKAGFKVQRTEVNWMALSIPWE